MLHAALITRLTNTPSGRRRYDRTQPKPVPLNQLWHFANLGSTEHYEKPLLARALEDLERQFFEERFREWYGDTRFESSLSRITAHRRYAEIVQMGDVALKLILEKMKDGEVHIHWFPALKDIARHDPVPVQKRGRIPEMAKAWIKWGRQTGRI